MTITDFEPTTYADPSGQIRAVKVGVLWYGEAKDARGRWIEHARHCTNYVSAVGLTLAALGLDEPDDERPACEIDW
jgi:hypothetical protein